MLLVRTVLQNDFLYVKDRKMLKRNYVKAPNFESFQHCVKLMGKALKIASFNEKSKHYDTFIKCYAKINMLNSVDIMSDLLALKIYFQVLFFGDSQ